MRVRMGSFLSPAAAYLQEESRTARFMLVTPGKNMPTSVRRLAVIFPCTGDQWYWCVRPEQPLGPVRETC